MSVFPSRRRALVALLSVAVLVVAVAVTLGRRPHVVAGAGHSPCGRFLVTAPDGQQWHCTFDDEFSGSGPDPRHWVAVTTAVSGFHSGAECFVDDARRVAVRGGHLALTLTRAATSSRCANYETPWSSGMITSTGRFAQAYGRFEIRAALPSVAGVQPALWLYPQSLAYGPWPASGEIDIAEVFGATHGRAWPHLHYLSAAGQGASTGRECTVRGAGRGFHTYAVDWSPGSFRFSYDGRTCLRVGALEPAGALPAPAPFDTPFFVALTLSTGVGDNQPGARTPASVTMLVDHVRVWGR